MTQLIDSQKAIQPFQLVCHQTCLRLEDLHFITMSVLPVISIEEGRAGGIII